MRIVSLLASGTEIVCALGAGEWLVGRSHECDNPGWVRSLPQCSEPAFDVSVSSGEIDREVRRRLQAGEPLYVIHHDLIRSLEPDVIIAQTHCEVCAVTPGDVKRNGNSGIQQAMTALSAPSVAEIFGSVQQIGQRIGRDAQPVVRELRDRIERVRQKTAHLAPPSVVVMEWVDPIFSLGNWGPELVEIAGGTPLLSHPGELSRSIPAELLHQADPDVLIIAPCGFNLERALEERAVLERLPWWKDLKAVRRGRVAFADGNLYFNRAGITIARTAEILAEILHGVQTGGPAEGNCWRWYTEARVRVV